MTASVTTKTLRSEAGVIAGQRDAVIAEGPDTVDFLQGQLSQDVAALAPGEAGFSLLLHPQGKISAWFRITRVADDRFIIDVDAGWSDEVLTRLNRFKLRTNCEITVAPWTSLTLIGPGADDVAIEGVEHDMLTSWAGVPVRDVFGVALDIDSVASLPEIDADVFTALRVEGGIPRMGAELDDSTIPAAAGIVEGSVSFTKGCFTGQELVARIDSRGNNVPKRLVGVVITGAKAAHTGADVTSDQGASIGAITSSSWSDELEAAVALAYVSRAAEIGDVVTVAVDGETASAELRSLPLLKA